MKNKIQAIGVFCGSALGNNPKYKEIAEDLAVVLASLDIELIYGGGKVGVMGVLADAMLKANGKVIGVIPQFLYDMEVAHEDITELHIVGSMAERKELIFKLSDAFILLPGSYGSLEEYFEMLTALKLDLHSKPCGILNIANYYDHLIQFIDHNVDQGFLKTSDRKLMIVENSIQKLLQALFERPIRTKSSVLDKSFALDISR